MEFETRQLFDANILLERLKRKAGLNTTQWHAKAQNIAGASIGSRSTLAEVLTGNSKRKLPLKSIPYLIEALGLEAEENDYYVGAFMRVFLPRGCQKYVSTTKAQEQIDTLKDENIGLIRKLSDLESYRLLSKIGGPEKIVELEKAYGIKRQNYDLPVKSSYDMFNNAPDFGPYEEIAKHGEKIHHHKMCEWIKFIIKVIKTEDIELQQFVCCLLPMEYKEVFDSLFVPVEEHYQAFFVDTPLRAYMFASWLYHYSTKEVKLDALLSVYALHHTKSFNETLKVNQVSYMPDNYDDLSEESKVEVIQSQYEHRLSKYDNIRNPFHMFLEKNLRKIRALSADIYNQISPFGVETHIDFRFDGEFAINRFLPFYAKHFSKFTPKKIVNTFRIEQTEFFPTLLERKQGLLEFLQFMILRDPIHIQDKYTSISEWEEKKNIPNSAELRKKCNFIVDSKQTLQGLLLGAEKYIALLNKH